MSSARPGQFKRRDQILAMMEEGLSERVISIRLNISRRAVRNVREAVQIDAGEEGFRVDRLREKEISRGSAKLMAAIRLHHPERCRSDVIPAAAAPVFDILQVDPADCSRGGQLMFDSPPCQPWSTGSAQ